LLEEEDREIKNEEPEDWRRRRGRRTRSDCQVFYLGLLSPALSGLKKGWMSLILRVLSGV
jgi:hypothetical protein